MMAVGREHLGSIGSLGGKRTLAALIHNERAGRFWKNSRGCLEASICTGLALMSDDDLLLTAMPLAKPNKKEGCSPSTSSTTLDDDTLQ